MTARIPAWEIVTGNHYTITEDDLVDGATSSASRSICR
jgi:hypothetical protein